mgnify:FL=1
MTTQPRIIIIAGPNGAGKTTFAREILPREADCPEFINAGLIAAGLSSFQPRVAAVRTRRLMLHEIGAMHSVGTAFASEIPRLGSSYARRTPRRQPSGN